MTCTTCGAELAPTDRFCSGCGRAAAARPAPSVASVATGGLARLISCDWKAPLRIAGITLGSSLVLALVFGLASRPSSSDLHWSLKTTFAWLAWVWESTFGVNAVGGGHVSGSVQAYGFSGTATAGIGLGAMPLTLTVITLLIAAAAFRGAARQAPHAISAVLLGVRAALLTAIPLFVVSLFVSVTVDDLARLAGNQANAADVLNAIHGLQGSDSLGLSLSSTDAFFISLALLVSVFAASTLGRGEWFIGRIWGTLRLVLIAPIRAFGRMAIALVIGGLVTEFAVWVVKWNTPSTWGPVGHPPHLSLHQWITAIAGAIAYAGNAGALALGAGTWGKLGAWGSVSGSGDGFSMSRSVRADHWIGWLAQRGELGTGTWIVLAVAPIILAYAAWSVARLHGSDARSVVTSLGTWLISLVLAVPVLAWAANLTAGGSATVQGQVSGVGASLSGHASGSLGLEIGIDTLLVFAYGVVICAAMGLMLGAFRRRTSAADTAPLSTPQ